MTTDAMANSTETPSGIEVELELFAQPDIWRVRILGINALGLLHAHEARLLSILRNGGTVEVLLLNPESAEFRKRRNLEEKRKGRVSNRLLAEMEASVAILQDMLNLLLNQHEHDIETLKDRFQVRYYSSKADKSLLFVVTQATKSVLHRKLLDTSRLSADPSNYSLVTVERGTENEDYSSRQKAFKRIWKKAEIVSLDSLKSKIHILSPRQNDAPEIYRQAVELHEKRRLDDASALYDTVLGLDKPRKPTDAEMELAKKFLPRLNTTKSEPFKLKDIVVVIHPDKDKRLLAYHLIWEDDIDFLIDNDPADHEIVWVKYSKDLKVEGAWSYWHGKILSTAFAVPAANSSNSRVQVYVQWGKHASLLEGWKDYIGIDSPIPEYPEFHSLEFSRLCNERTPAEGHYAERWPKRFEGDFEEFIDFSVEIDVKRKLAEHNMVIVSRFGAAVISRHFLPYNIRAKIDWPDEIRKQEKNS